MSTGDTIVMVALLCLMPFVPFLLCLVCWFLDGKFGWLGGKSSPPECSYCEGMTSEGGYSSLSGEGGGLGGNQCPVCHKNL